MRDFSLIKMIITRFVGTGSFLIRYSNGHKKQNISPIEDAQLF